ncbi:hypothetical protein BH10ACT7_BH10ACT7_28460 [soil metagenome]
MHHAVDESTLAEILPGTWVIAATNFPMWLTGERQDPTFTYGLVSTDPLVLSDEVSFTTAEGEAKSILGQDTWQGEEFVWRGKGLLKVAKSRWTVTGSSEDGEVIAIHFTKSIATPAGIDIIVREGSAVPEIRAMIARDTERFGLTPEQFGSLTWLNANHAD